MWMRYLTPFAEPDEAPAREPLLDDEQEQEVQSFIQFFREKKDQRKYQLSLVKDFLDDPARFGIQPDVLPSSTTLEEFEDRRKELKYRMALMRTLLELMEDELQLLEKGEAYTRARDAESTPT